ncbi:MAG TPA: hypothetical protein VK169_15820 [Saprospiraceae bacterium]|nr:hypothetical protein [Saprospiraceae bacterium]
MRFLPFLLMFLFTSSIVFSQKETTSIQSFYPHKNEIGINFTNVLGNVLSLNPNNANSPYGLTYRRHLGKKSFRSAFSLQVNNEKNSDFENGFFVTRTINQTTSQFRVGLEKHIVLNKRVLFSYGFDILGKVMTDNSSVQDNNGFGTVTFTSKETTFGGGAGPMLRLEFKISDRLFISSESSLYGFYSRTTENLEFGNQPSEQTKSSDSNIELLLPQSLFFNISF